MKLMKYSITVPAENEDIVAASLYDCDVEGIEIEDSIPLSEDELRFMFVDIPKQIEETEDAVLSFYLDIEDENTEEILKRVKEELEGLKSSGILHNPEITVTDISQVNWQDNWKKYFKAFQIENIIIVPAWEDACEYEKDRHLVIRMDPGSAFGTGKHETTQLCIEEMKKELKEGARLLDIGTGSGILGIIGLKLGASFVHAVDVDENIIGCVNDNLKINDTNQDLFDLKIGDIARNQDLFSFLSEKEHDLIIANILPNILEELTPYVRKLMHKDSKYILSGILDVKEAEVEEFLVRNRLKVISRRQQGEWVAITTVLDEVK